MYIIQSNLSYTCNCIKKYFNLFLQVSLNRMSSQYHNLSTHTTSQEMVDTYLRDPYWMIIRIIIFTLPCLWGISILIAVVVLIFNSASDKGGCRLNNIRKRETQNA